MTVMELISLYFTAGIGVLFCANKVVSFAVLPGALFLLFQYRLHYKEVHVTNHFILKYKPF